MPFVAVIGNLVKDVVDGGLPRPGGAVFYQARAFHRIAPERDVHLVTRCAAADRELLVPPLEEFGLPLTWRPARETQAFSFHYEGEHRVMDVDALGDPWTRDDIEGWVAQAIGDASWVMVGALTRADFAPTRCPPSAPTDASCSSTGRGSSVAGRLARSFATPTFRRRHSPRCAD